MDAKGKSVTPTEKAARLVQNNCEIIKRLSGGNLDEEEMGEIGESLATGKTLGEIRMGKNVGSIFEGVFGPGFNPGFSRYQ